MKVLHFYKTYDPDDVGGVQKVINQIIRGADALGVTSEVLSLSSPSVERTVYVDGHRVHRCRQILKKKSTKKNRRVNKQT
jgi:rhamnosyl/mannosyltransferase